MKDTYILQYLDDDGEWKEVPYVKPDTRKEFIDYD